MRTDILCQGLTTLYAGDVPVPAAGYEKSLPQSPHLKHHQMVPTAPPVDTIRYQVDVTIDYTSSISEVYTTLTLLILNARQDLTLLFELSDGHAIGLGRANTGPSPAGSSTWVPDFCQIDWSSIRRSIRVYDTGQYYQADTRTYEPNEQSCQRENRDHKLDHDEKERKLRTWIHQAGPALHLPGVRMAEIDVVQEPNPPDPDLPQKWPAAVTVCSPLGTSLLRSVLRRDSDCNWVDQSPRPVAVERCEIDTDIREEARLLFQSDHLTTWLQHELVWHVSKGTEPGDLVVACGRGWPLILRRRIAGGWGYVGYCEPTVPSHCYSRVPGHNGWRRDFRNGFRGLTPLFQDVCKWAAIEDFEHFEVF
ncbi:hypothetical protein LTR09_007768 [Extremus antarcticus]|uniref:Uncharacterized protein n=1 Tax=Extremus antarcticus TaxID=702011 RepID=A0AAJ0DIL1_9PEZI|nr:hypothetical protein LTR09_007768 [Extremus antarcticus]